MNNPEKEKRKEKRLLERKKGSPLSQHSVVDPAPRVFFLSQPDPVLQVPFLSQKTLEERGPFTFTQIWCENYYHQRKEVSGTKSLSGLQINLNSLVGDDSQRPSSRGAVPLALIPAKPEGGQVKARSSKSQPAICTLLAAGFWKEREIQYRQC